METNSIPTMDLATLLATAGSTGQTPTTGLALTEPESSAFMALLNQVVADGASQVADAIPTSGEANAATALLAATQVVDLGQIALDQQALPATSESPTALVTALVPELAANPTEPAATLSDDDLPVVTESAVATEAANNEAAAAQAMQQMLATTLTAPPAAPLKDLQPPSAAITAAAPGQNQQQPVTATPAALSAVTSQETAAGQNVRRSTAALTTNTAGPEQKVTAPANQELPVKEAAAELGQRLQSPDQKPLKPHAHELQALVAPPSGEQIKQTTIPRDVAIEVAISEGTADTAQQLQAPANAGQQQDLANEQRAAHALVQGGKNVAPQPVTPTETTTVTVNHESLLEQVKDRLAAPEVRADGNQIRLQLRPADLGELQITLRMDDQKLRVEILAENKAVKTALLEHADTLKDVLARQHITVDRFDVGTGSNSGFGQLFREGNRPEDQRTLPRYTANSGFRQSVGTPVAAAWQPRGNALVDVRF